MSYPTRSRQDAPAAPARKATLARRQDLAARLLDLAEAAIDAAGLRELRARSLAEEAGCSVGAIYGVFADLDALVLAVNARTLDAIDIALRPANPDADPVRQLTALAEAYLDFVDANRRRWDALFTHRMADGSAVPDWYAARQRAAFGHVEAPLTLLLPAMPAADRAQLARSMFAAVHGMIVLGLDSPLTATPIPVLRGQIEIVVAAIARGIMPPPPKPAPSR